MAPVLGVHQDLSPTWLGKMATVPSLLLKAPALVAASPGLSLDCSFLWLPCIHSILPLPTLSTSLACLLTMPGAKSGPSSPCPHSLQGSKSVCPEVTFPCPRDTCPGSISKRLASFTNGINGIICQIQKDTF
jgi:hypothetical protein